MQYHNTNGLIGNDLKHADQKAMTQEEWVLQHFKTYAYQKHSPFSVKRAYDKAHGTDIPITSIRRAISNLSCNGGVLVCLKDLPKIKTIYGGYEYLWEYKTGQEEMF